MSMINKAAPALTLLLCACSSVSTQFYTLLPPPQQRQPAAAFQIEVEPVDLPSQVSTQQLVVRTGGGEMTPLDTRHWIAPLGDEIRGALAADLTQRLGASDVYGLANATQKPGVITWRIDLKVQRFESALGAYARIDAVWTVRKVGDDAATVAACSSSVSNTVQSGYAALVEGHQHALAELAGQIATVVAAAQRGQSPGCPAG